MVPSLTPPVLGPEDDQPAILAAINPTPLVDVMLVLLIILLITVPVLSAAPPVALPQEAAATEPGQPATLTLTLERQGQLFWNDRRLPDAAALTWQLQQLASQGPLPPVHLRADRETPYAAVAEVVAACRQAGVRRLGFVTAAPPAAAGGSPR